jgi:hypothetical protein
VHFASRINLVSNQRKAETEANVSPPSDSSLKRQDRKARRVASAAAALLQLLTLQRNVRLNGESVHFAPLLYNMKLRRTNQWGQ